MVYTQCLNTDMILKSPKISSAGPDSTLLQQIAQLFTLYTLLKYM